MIRVDINDRLSAVGIMHLCGFKLIYRSYPSPFFPVRRVHYALRLVESLSVTLSSTTDLQKKTDQFSFHLTPEQRGLQESRAKQI